MQYLLSEEEYQALVGIEKLNFEKQRVQYLIRQFKKIACNNPKSRGYCDGCVLSTISHDLGKFCENQYHSK